MSDPVAVCNLALSWVGGSLISSLDDPQTESRLCKAQYDRLRKSLLNTGHFSFAYRRLVFSTPLAAPPEWGFDFAYAIPPGTIKVWSVRRQDTGAEFIKQGLDTIVDWAQVGQEIHTNEALILVELIVDEVNTNNFSELFEQALAARLAADIAMPLTQNRSLQADMWRLAEGKLDEAAGHDNQAIQKGLQKTTGLILARNRSSVGIGRDGLG